MPIFEVLCRDCGKMGEVLVFAGNEALICPHCGSAQTAKLMSATSSLTGRESAGLGSRQSGIAQAARDPTRTTENEGSR